MNAQSTEEEPIEAALIEMFHIYIVCNSIKIHKHTRIIYDIIW